MVRGSKEELEDDFDDALLEELLRDDLPEDVPTPLSRVQTEYNTKNPESSVNRSWVQRTRSIQEIVRAFLKTENLGIYALRVSLLQLGFLVGLALLVFITQIVGIILFGAGFLLLFLNSTIWNLAEKRFVESLIFIPIYYWLLLPVLGVFVIALPFSAVESRLVSLSIATIALGLYSLPAVHQFYIMCQPRSDISVAKHLIMLLALFWPVLFFIIMFYL